MARQFSLSAKFSPSGDQPQAIAQLIKGLDAGRTHQTLKGVTGSGKTFTMANVIATSQRPTIILAHNKTLAAQLYGEMKAFFPENSVEYFVSYYDYYQPEAYIPSTDTFIEKDASVNSHIERMRLSTTKALIERRDVIVVASVSSVYGLGTPETYRAMQIPLQIGKPLEQRSFLHRLAELQYTRCGKTIERATFRVRGEVIDVFPADSERDAIRIELFDNEIEHLSCIDPITGVVIEKVEHYLISPKTLYATPRETIEKAAGLIRKEVKKQHKYFIDHNQLIEANRILERTRLDTEMMLELGYCSGIENYSRYLSDHKPNQPPSTLLDYLPRDGLLFVDESHVMIPQISAMFSGDKKRKEVLVQYGFRLPSALDNRPLMFSEFEAIKPQTIFVSATPGEYELERSLGVAVEQLIRPTGLLDPIIEVHSAHNQIEHLLPEIQKCIKKDERVLITTLTKKMAEELAEKLDNIGVPVRYIHGDIVTAERVNIIRDLRLGVFDVLIGVNLLREGLDIPEVSLVVILNADARGFLRTERALTQTIGRAARNINGKAILYGDVITEAMQRAIDETEYRRTKQAEYNQKHGIVVRPISRDISIESFTDKPVKPSSLDSNANSDPLADLTTEITKLEKRMTAAAENLDFEGAALIRDQISALYQQFIS